MSITECAHCMRLCDARETSPCADCGSPICADCAREGECPEGAEEMR